jgi:hypothetical protein
MEPPSNLIVDGAAEDEVLLSLNLLVDGIASKSYLIDQSGGQSLL